MAIRKNAANLTSSEMDTFVAALKELKRSGRYDLYVLQHAQSVMSNIHRCAAFLPWHRQLLWELERELQEIANDPNLAIPYWHWGDNATYDNPEDYPMWSDRFLGPGGRSFNGHIVRSGPFREGEWTIIDMQGNPAGPLVRELGESPIANSLPSKEQIEAMLRVMPFDTSPYDMDTRAGFRNLLEGWYGGSEPMFHNRGHVWVGGSMIPMTSPNDPVFFLHHCFVDKLWWDWQERHSPMGMEPYLPLHGERAGQNLDDLMEAGMTGRFKPSDVLDVIQLGYSYDAPEPTIDTTIVFTQEGSDGGIDHSGHEGHGGHEDPNNHDDHNTGDHQDTNPGNDDGVAGGDEGTGGGHDHSDHGAGGSSEDTGNDVPTTGGGGSSTGSGTSSGGSGRRRGCMLTFILIFGILVFACGSSMKSGKITGFEKYERKAIVSSVYWYFDIALGEKDVYKVLTNKEDIYFEVVGGQQSFTLEGPQIEAANVKVITKDNNCFLGKGGKISGSLNGDQLDLDMDFNSQSAKSNAQGEFIIKEATDKELHEVRVKGVALRVND